jgi:CHAT domain-containing protein
MIDNSQLKLYEQAYFLSRENGDWPTFVRSADRLAMAILVKSSNDGVQNNELALSIIQEAYGKALDLKDQQLLLRICETLVVVGVSQLENIDSKIFLPKQILECGEYVIANSQDWRAKMRVTNNLLIFEQTKKPDKNLFIRWYGFLCDIYQHLKMEELDFEDIIGFIHKKITAYEYTRDLKILNEIDNLFSYIKNNHTNVFEQPNMLGYLFFKERAALSDLLGEDENYIIYQTEALRHIKPYSPIDAANILYALAVRYKKKGEMDMAVNAIVQSDQHIDLMWKVAWSRVNEQQLNVVRSDLFFYSWYFRLTYEMGAQLFLDQNKLVQSIAWREKGLIKFYLTTIKGLYDDRFNNEEKIVFKLEKMVRENPGTLFLHFSIDGIVSSCIAWMDGYPLKFADYGVNLYHKLMMLMDTPYDTEYGFWDYYASWQRTGGEGAFKRWKEVINLVSGLLGSIIFEPLSVLLDEPGLKKIVVVCNGWMDGLPWQSAKVNGQYLIDRFSVVTMPSMLLNSLFSAHKANGISIMEGQHTDLPWAKVEVAQISKICRNNHLPVRAVSEEMDSVDIFSSILKEVKTSVIHMATHMSYVQDISSETSIIFNMNGKLEKLMVEDILMGGRFKVPAGSALILSGCESNTMNYMKNGDHVSLARSFLLSGARSIIGSSWAVDDMATYFLMCQLYSNWLADEKPDFSSALAAAQRWIRVQDVHSLLANEIMNDELKGLLLQKYPDRDCRPFEHPYYWAAWSYTGAV